MNKSPQKPFYDFLVYAFLVLVFIAYFEYFGEYGPFFYLIHTPPQLLFIPPILFLLWKWYKKESIIPTVIILATMSVVLAFIAGRTVIWEQSIPRNAERIRLCSWNTAYFFKWGREEGFQRLKDSQCDYILLQEVWRSDQELTAITDMKKAYLPDFDIYTEDEFLFLTPKSTHVTEITSDHAGYFGINTVFKGKEFSLLSVHLWNPITPKPIVSNGIFSRIPAKQARFEQKEELLAKIRELTLEKERSVVVVGDFNTMQNGKILREIPQQSNTSNPLRVLSLPIWQNRATYSTTMRILQIDYAFITPATFSNSKLQLSCEAKASDHCLLIIDLVL